jgi:hypothetical protein
MASTRKNLEPGALVAGFHEIFLITCVEVEEKGNETCVNYTTLWADGSIAPYSKNFFDSLFEKGIIQMLDS